MVCLLLNINSEWTNICEIFRFVVFYKTSALDVEMNSDNITYLYIGKLLTFITNELKLRSVISIISRLSGVRIELANCYDNIRYRVGRSRF